jgi:hypothetical protein
VVTTAGRFSGRAPIAKATAAVKTVVNLSPRARFSAIDTIRATPAIHRICWVSLSSWRVRGVLTACSACRLRTALNNVRRIRTMPVSHSCRNRLTTPATSKTICIGSAY